MAIILKLKSPMNPIHMRKKEIQCQWVAITLKCSKHIMVTKQTIKIYRFVKSI